MEYQIQSSTGYTVHWFLSHTSQPETKTIVLKHFFTFAGPPMFPRLTLTYFYTSAVAREETLPCETNTVVVWGIRGKLPNLVKFPWGRLQAKVLANSKPVLHDQTTTDCNWSISSTGLHEYTRHTHNLLTRHIAKTEDCLLPCKKENRIFI